MSIPLPATKAELPSPISSCLLCQPQEQNYPILSLYQFMLNLPATREQNYPIISVHAYYTSHKGRTTQSYHCITSCLLYQSQGQSYPILSLYHFMLTLPVTRAELPNHISSCLLYQLQEQNYPILSVHAYYTSYKSRTTQSYQVMLIIPATRAELSIPIRSCLLYQPQDQNYHQLMFNVYLPWHYGVWLPAMATCEIPLLFFDCYMSGIFCVLHRGPPTVTFSQTFSLTTVVAGGSEVNSSIQMNAICLIWLQLISLLKSTSLSLYCYTIACDIQVGHPGLFHVSY